jgi:hypothetical protein
MNRPPRLVLLSLGLVVVGCRDELASTQQVASQTLGQGKQLVANAIQTATAVASELQGSAQKMFTGLRADGKLSDAATALVAAAAAAPDGIEKTIAKGTQLAPAAWEVAKIVNGAVDDETVIEPIIEDASDKAAVDKAIGAMPRVEVIDGVQVGFRKLDSLDTQKSVKERAFLVAWRRGDKLLGFVYRSKREVDLDALVKAAPKLVALFDSAVP